MVLISEVKSSAISRLIAGLQKRVFVYGLLTVPLTIAACFAQAGWLFELCSHFRMQFLIVNILLLALALFKKRFVIAVVAALSASVNFVEMFDASNDGLVESTKSSPTKRALLFNLNSMNFRLDKVREFIKDSNPDVIVMPS